MADQAQGRRWRQGAVGRGKGSGRRPQALLPHHRARRAAEGRCHRQRIRQGPGRASARGWAAGGAGGP
eukprot:18265-Alexandrium_andersonii.AAC.1